MCGVIDVLRALRPYLQYLSETPNAIKSTNVQLLQDDKHFNFKSTNFQNKLAIVKISIAYSGIYIDIKLVFLILVIKPLFKYEVKVVSSTTSRLNYVQIKLYQRKLLIYGCPERLTWAE